MVLLDLFKLVVQLGLRFKLDLLQLLELFLEQLHLLLELGDVLLEAVLVSLDDFSVLFELLHLGVLLNQLDVVLVKVLLSLLQVGQQVLVVSDILSEVLKVSFAVVKQPPANTLHLGKLIAVSNQSHG